MIPMTIFDANCLYVLKCLALVFLVAPCVLFAGGMLICLLMWCGLHITRAMHLRRLGLPRCGRCRYWATVQCPLYGHNTPSDFCSRGEWHAVSNLLSGKIPPAYHQGKTQAHPRPPDGRPCKRNPSVNQSRSP